MKRRVIEINEEKCNGCGACANACHEGAIEIINGKARLMRDDYCDGLGDCLPSCPMDAISFVEREAAAYDEEAVKAHLEKKIKKLDLTQNMNTQPVHTGGCPGSAARQLRQSAAGVQNAEQVQAAPSMLKQWPVQIKLLPVKAPFYDGAKLLVAADCSAYAYGNFHQEFIKDHITLIGCPKLDEGDYSEKLTEIIKLNDIKSVTIVRMEVPCCGGLERAVKTALQNSGKFLPWQVVTITADGKQI